MPQLIRQRVLRTRSQQRDLLRQNESSRCCVTCLIWVSGVIMGGLLSLLVAVLVLSHDRSTRVIMTEPNNMDAVTLEKLESQRAEVQQKRAAACRRMRDMTDIRQCYPSQILKHLGDDCRNIDDWKDVQRCLMGNFYYDVNHDPQQDKVTITEIHVIGERNSGTKFVTNTLQQCFPRGASGVRVHRDFIRSKHFFQPIVKGDFRSSLVVVVVRDPVEWVASMREHPYHAPDHIVGFNSFNNTVIPLEWHDFVNKPWTTVNTDIDRRLALNETARKQRICRENFLMHQVRPCRSDNRTANPWKIPESRWRGYEPIYEQRKNNGQPYGNLLQLRADKIVNWVFQLPMVMKIGGFVVVRYEDLLEHGTGFLLQQVTNILSNSTASGSAPPLGCKPAPPQPERLGKRHIADEFRAWINEHVDVETERLIGYR